MSGYSFPPPGSGYGYGRQPATAQPYAAPSAPPTAQPYAPSAPPHSKPSSAPYAPPPPSGYAPPPPSGYAPPPPAAGGGYARPSSGSYPGAGDPYNSPFSSLMPSVFPPGTDPNIIACFQVADQDGSGIIDDKELQRALSSYNQSFSMRTVHLLMYTFTGTNTGKIGQFLLPAYVSLLLLFIVNCASDAVAYALHLPAVIRVTRGWFYVMN